LFEYILGSKLVSTTLLKVAKEKNVIKKYQIED